MALLFVNVITLAKEITLKISCKLTEYISRSILLNNNVLLFLDYCVYVVTTVLISDLTLRCFQLANEWFRFKSRYLPEDNFCRMIQLTFSYNTASGIFFTVFAVICAIRRTVQSEIHTNLYPISPTFLLVGIPMYWLITFIQLSKNNLHYAHWIRETHGLDYGEGMASSYYHGYLKLTLPSSSNNIPGIKKRIDMYEASHNVTFACYCLIILVPSTLFTKPIIESDLLEKVAVSIFI